MPACSDADSAEVAEERARIDAEFGPRDDAAGSVAAGDAPVEQSEPRVEPSGDAAEDASPAPDATRPAGDPPRKTEDGDPPAASTPAPALPDQGEPGPVDVDSLLALANSAYASLDRLRAAFSQRIENPLLGRTREGRGSWHQAGRNRFRMDFEEPADDVYVADGSCLWLYEPSLHDQVMVSALEEGVEIGTIDILGRLLSEARTRYDGVDDGVEDIDGVETRVVSLTPRQLPARYVEVRLWIGVSDHYVRRFRIREENQTLRTVTLTRLEPQAPIDPSVFDYAPPAGVPVFPDDVRCD
ncbi:LolA family protein [Candidatus Palauibacter sp.]|uniref:LolA family protein n=1 Tax=Candidatus Palauibacter sp. TaxID=3101350 RepID=UPI003B5188C4